MVGAMYSIMIYGRDQSTANPDFVLTPTAVAHTYCKYHANCHENEDIGKMLEYLEQIVVEHSQAKHSSRVTKERFMVAVKGLGNIGLVSDDFEPTLRQLIEDESLSLEIRLEIVYIHRRMDCEATRDYFLDLYRNYTANTELRIAAYLQAMRCPDYVSVQYIKDVLQTEPVNQVGSFVWSHLTNLAKASSPVRVEAQGLLIDGDLGAKYKLDIRKFSKNFEHSVFFDEYNFGVNAESNLIFSTDSYMPRVANLNFTVDLFGESVNLLELSTRMEGFEHLIESIFGPKGPLNRERFRNKFTFLNKFMRDSSKGEDWL